MAEIVEKSAESAEGSEGALERVANFGEQMSKSLERLKKEKELAPEDAFEDLARGLSRWLGERAEDAGKMAEFARHSLEAANLHETEIGKALVGGLEKVQKFLETGAEGLKGEKVEAFVTLLALVFLTAVNPSGALEMLSKKPELLGHALATLAA